MNDMLRLKLHHDKFSASRENSYKIEVTVRWDKANLEGLKVAW